MPLLYNTSINKDGSYDFTTDNKIIYTVYFLEYTLPDTDGNNHIVYNFGFTRDENYSSEKFVHKFDIKIMNTIVSIINEFFIKNEDKALLYFCYNDDGLGRHRNITFKIWCKKLDSTIETHQKSVIAQNASFYGSCLIIKNNPLKKLIVDAFEANMAELMELNS